MLTHDYLGLRLNRLTASEEWTLSGEGLAFILPSDGKGDYVAGAVAHPFGPGDVLVFNLAEAGKMCVHSDRDLVFRYFSVKIENLFPLFANHEVHMLQGLESRFKHFRLYAANTPVAVQCHRLLGSAPPLFNLDHRSHVLRIAAVVFSDELTAGRPVPLGCAGVDEQLDLVFDSLSTDEILDLSIDELAAKFHCSRRNLNRLFHHRFKLSVSALRMELRLLKAASLLRDANAKVINVADQSGFNHLGLFNTCFKRRFGVSPGQWRKQPQEAERRPQPVLTHPKCSLRDGGLCPLADAYGNGPESPVQPPTSAAARIALKVFASRPNPAVAARGKQNRGVVGKIKVRLSA